jgi:hypothetical protein
MARRVAKFIVADVVFANITQTNRISLIGVFLLKSIL